MTIRTPKQALAVALGTLTNAEGFCQQVTRGYYNAPSAGDVDGDGDFDAYDGWLKEPTTARHPGDRNPPAGYPVSFRNRHGHRAISIGGGRIRSTDFDGIAKRYKAGVLGNGTIAEVEAAMNVVYLGWSETIDGIPIPKDAAKEESVATEPAPKYTAKVAALFAQVTSLANQILAATTPGTVNYHGAWLIRAISKKLDGSK